MKVCSRCNTEKPIDQFHKRKSGNLYAYCVECHKLYVNAHYQNNKQYYSDKARKAEKESRDWFKNLKDSLKCSKCDEDYNLCLEFHHLDPSVKEGNLSDMARRCVSKERILEELNKCICVCANCHRKIHGGMIIP